MLFLNQGNKPANKRSALLIGIARHKPYSIKSNAHSATTRIHKFGSRPALSLLDKSILALQKKGGNCV
jgi:hypothetical protein